MNEGKEATDIHKISRNKLKFVVALALLTIICVGSLVQEWNFGSEDATSSIFNNINNTSQKDYYELYNDTHQQSSSSSLLSKNISTKTTSTSTIAADDRIVCSTATNENFQFYMLNQKSPAHPMQHFCIG